MNENYPSKFIEKYPRKFAFLIDCLNGIKMRNLFPRFLDNFPPNSDIFFFHEYNEPGMTRRLKRFASTTHGVYFCPTSETSLGFNLSFLLGQISEKYQDFILVSEYNSAYEDLCEQLVKTNVQLENHVQFRCFDGLNEFTQFLHEITRLENEDKPANETESIILNYSQENLFHSCPFETKQQSSYLYRFGQLLHHLDTEHSNIHYEYCSECKQIIDDKNTLASDTFEKHVQDKHWGRNNGFQLAIWPSE
jgi:hypothetical protein